MQKKKVLYIIRCNKQIQPRLNLDINDYKEYSESFSSIEIEIIPTKNKYGKFMRNIEDNEKDYFHIYFNNDKTDIKRTYNIKSDYARIINIRIVNTL